MKLSTYPENPNNLDNDEKKNDWIQSVALLIPRCLICEVDEATFFNEFKRFLSRWVVGKHPGEEEKEDNAEIHEQPNVDLIWIFYFHLVTLK